MSSIINYNSYGNDLFVNNFSATPRAKNTFFPLLILISLLATIIGCASIIVGFLNTVHMTTFLLLGVSLVLLGITLFIAFYSLNKKLKQVFLNININHNLDSLLIHLRNTGINTILTKPEVSIFNNNDNTDVIADSIWPILSGTFMNENLSVTPWNDDCLLINFDKDPYVYKLSYCSRNTNVTESYSKIYKYVESNHIAETICHKYRLDKIKSPKMHYKSIPLIGAPTLSYDLAAEERLPFKIVTSEQENLYKNPSKNLNKIVRQLTNFICLTGCSSIDFNHIPINPHSTDQVYLIDVDINLEVTKDRIEDGFFGTRLKRGLINCLGSEQLIYMVLDIIKSRGIDINSKRACRAISDRLAYLKMKDQLEQLYASPPSKINTFKIEDINLSKVDASIVLDVSQESYNLLYDNLQKIIDLKSIHLLSKRIQHLKKHPFDFDVFRIDGDDNLYCNYYSGNIFYGAYVDEINEKVKNIYKTTVLMHKIIKKRKLDMLILPKTKLVSFNKYGKTYYMLAIEPLPILHEESGLFNTHNYRKDAQKALAQLVELNNSIGLNINNKNTFLLKKDSYEIALINLLQSDPVVGLLGDCHLEKNDLGLLKFADKDQTLHICLDDDDQVQSDPDYKLYVSQESEQFLQNTICNLINPRSIYTAPKDVKAIERSAFNYKMFTMDGDYRYATPETIYCNFYVEDQFIFDDNYVNEVNHQILNIYKSIILIHNTIRDYKLDYLKAPLVKLLTFNKYGKKYYILAIERHLVERRITDPFASNQVLLQGLAQLETLNKITGLNINSCDTFLSPTLTSRYTQGQISYKLDIVNVMQVSSKSIIENVDTTDNNYGILRFANSEHILDAMIFEGAKLGFLNKNVAEKQRKSCLFLMEDSLRVQHFYEQKSMNYDQTIDISFEDLKDYLDLDLETSATDIPYFKQKGIELVSMRAAIVDIVKELNRILATTLLPTSWDLAAYGVNRLVLEIIKQNDVFQAYSMIYFNQEQVIDGLEFMPSCLYLVKEALIAKGVALPPCILYGITRFDKGIFSTYI